MGHRATVLYTSNYCVLNKSILVQNLILGKYSGYQLKTKHARFNALIMILLKIAEPQINRIIIIIFNHAPSTLDRVQTTPTILNEKSGCDCVRGYVQMVF